HTSATASQPRSNAPALVLEAKDSVPTRRSSDLVQPGDVAERHQTDQHYRYDEPEALVRGVHHGRQQHHGEVGGEEPQRDRGVPRSEEHTSELQSRENLVCRLPRENNASTPPAQS